VKKILIVMFVFVIGCGSLSDKKGIDFVGYNKGGVNKIYSVASGRKTVEVVSPVQAEEEEKKIDSVSYDVEISGQMEFDVFARYVANLLNYVYVKKVDVVYSLIDVDVKSKLTAGELYEVLRSVGVVAGVEVSLVENVLELKLIGESVPGFFKFVKLNYVNNSLGVLDVSVKYFRIPSGVVLFGDRNLVLSVEKMLLYLDVDYMAGVEVVLIPYDLGLCESVKKSLDVVWKNEINFVGVSESVSALIMRNGSDKKLVLSMLEKFRDSKLIQFFYIPVRQAKSKDIQEKLKVLLPTVEIVLADNSLVLKRYDDYRNVLSVMKGLDYVERMIYLEVYVLDIQSRSTKNIGFDIKKVGSTGFSTALRSSVGFGLYSNFGDFSTFFNYLLTEFDGRVLSSPYCILQNKTKATMNFGQRIPTLQSKSSTTAGELIQNVEYTDIGLILNMGIELVGDCIYSDLSIRNSSVLEDVGVEGNPQFSNDSIQVNLVMKSGNVAVIAGLKRQGLERSRKSILFPFSYFKKNEKREMLVCVHAKEIGFDDSMGDVLIKIKNLLDNGKKN